MLLLSDSAPIGLLPRRLAWDVLQAVAAGAYADVALERVLRERDLKPSDRGLVTELAYGAIRQRRTLDAWLDLLGNCLLYTSPSPRDATLSRMPSSA